jgi:kynurenine formamidase
MQSTTQIDGLRHFRHPVHGFYNHAPDDEISVGSPRIGINRWAENGIVGRGVLIDIERHLASQGKRLDHRAGEAFTVDLVDAAAAAQGVAFKPGDILLLRTGWMRFYFAEMTQAECDALPGNLRSPGLIQSHETLAWIWDHQFAMCASDNVALESFPPAPSSPFAAELARIAGVHATHAAMMHPFMIALLGLAVGELWSLDALAEDCARDGVWECLVTAKPLNLIGGVGSPANAIAVK